MRLAAEMILAPRQTGVGELIPLQGAALDARPVDLDPVRLASLAALITNLTFEQCLDALPSAVASGEDGPWLFGIDDAIVDGLAALRAEDALTQADAWIAETDWDIDGKRAEDVAPLLLALAALARESRALQARLYLRLSVAPTRSRRARRAATWRSTLAHAGAQRDGWSSSHSRRTGAA